MTKLFLFGITAAKREGRNLLLLKVMAENTEDGKKLLEHIEGYIEAEYAGEHYVTGKPIDIITEHVGWHNKKKIM